MFFCYYVFTCYYVQSSRGMMGEMMGEITGEINEVQNPRTPFVQGISRISMGEMRDFFAKHTKNLQCKTKNLHVYAFLVWTEQKGSLSVLNYEFATDKPLVWYRQTQPRENDGYLCKLQNRYTFWYKLSPCHVEYPIEAILKDV